MTQLLFSFINTAIYIDTESKCGLKEAAISCPPISAVVQYTGLLELFSLSPNIWEKELVFFAFGFLKIQCL